MRSHSAALSQDLIQLRAIRECGDDAERGPLAGVSRP
jgi:hypothetical protein